MRRPLALDLYCGGGGVAEGLIAAGWRVVGVDRNRNCGKYYPGEFVHADVLDSCVDIGAFDFVWASPPCQRFSKATPVELRDRHPDLIDVTRKLLDGHELTCIENVPNAPIRSDLILNGPTVGLNRIVRERHFELSFPLAFRLGQPPLKHTTKADWQSGRMVSITKSLSARSHYYPRKALGLRGRVSRDEAAEVMGYTGPMTGEMIGESIPPRYSQIIGEAALQICMETAWTI